MHISNEGGLRDYSARLLAGTGLDGDDAEAVSSGTRTDTRPRRTHDSTVLTDTSRLYRPDSVPERAAAAAAAMRDGWAVAAQTAGQS